MEERIVLEAIEAHKAEAIKHAIDAFNDGFRLGVEHANREFGKNK